MHTQLTAVHKSWTSRFYPQGPIGLPFANVSLTLRVSIQTSCMIQGQPHCGCWQQRKRKELLEKDGCGSVIYTSTHRRVKCIKSLSQYFKEVCSLKLKNILTEEPCKPNTMRKHNMECTVRCCNRTCAARMEWSRAAHVKDESSSTWGLEAHPCVFADG